MLFLSNFQNFYS